MKFSLGIFLPPTIDNDRYRTRVARWLYKFILLLLVMIGVQMVILMVRDNELFPWPSLPILLFVVAVNVFSLWLLHRGYIRMIGGFVVLSVFAAVSYVLFLSDGIRGPDVTMYFVLLTFTGLFIGRRMAFVFTAVASAMLGFLLYAEYSGWLHSDLPAVPSVTIFLAYTFMLVLQAVLLYLMIGGLQESEVEARTAAAVISQSNESLRQKQAELTAALETLQTKQQELQENYQQLRDAKQEAEAASLAKNEFLALMSHELRTPLNVILGLGELMELGYTGELSPEQVEAVETMRVSGQHLLNLINDILNVSQSVSGDFVLHFQPVQLAELCSDCLTLTKAAAQQKQIEVEINVKKLAALPVIEGDPVRLKQVFMHLLSNAVKFTPAGGRMGVLVTPNQTHQEIRVVIWDTGIGIAPENLPHIFDPFVQIDRGLTRTYEGVGLGLSLVKTFIDLHHGRLEVESNLDQGSRFTVILPFKQPPPSD